MICTNCGSKAEDGYCFNCGWYCSDVDFLNLVKQTFGQKDELKPTSELRINKTKCPGCESQLFKSVDKQYRICLNCGWSERRIQVKIQNPVDIMEYTIEFILEYGIEEYDKRVKQVSINDFSRILGIGQYNSSIGVN